MLAHGVTFFIVSLVGTVRAGNTTCKSTSLDWFTNSVGETPCRMYERLRQTCSPGYDVPSMGASPPGDVCNDQVSTCCCNSIAFALQMLCMNCQYGYGSSVNGDTGFDAAAGTYNLYLNKCTPVTNQGLPNITQTAACKQNINIPRYLYELFWVPGDWYYEYTKGAAQLQIQSGNNDTGICPKPTASTSASATASATGGGSSVSAVPSEPSDNVSVGAIVGGVVGGVVLLALAALAGFFIARKRKQRGIIDLTEDEKPLDMAFEPYPVLPGGYSQNVARPPYEALTSSEWTYTDASSSAPVSVAPPPRHYKPGQIAPSPPTQSETYSSQPYLSPPGAMPNPSGPERHEDSEMLSGAYGLGRSASGRLPPSYRAR